MDVAYFFQILGTTGSLIMCASSIPQIMKTYRMKCAANLSGSYLAILMIGMSLILLYAVYVRDIVFIFGNGISLILTGILIVLRYKYDISTRANEKGCIK
jgi:MtN3 and saliva related transmembrane protein